jgi:hypothetical protein
MHIHHNLCAMVFGFVYWRCTREWTTTINTIGRWQASHKQQAVAENRCVKCTQPKGQDTEAIHSPKAKQALNDFPPTVYLKATWLVICGPTQWPQKAFCCKRHCKTSPVFLQRFWSQVWQKIRPKTDRIISGQTPLKYPGLLHVSQRPDKQALAKRSKKAAMQVTASAATGTSQRAITSPKTDCEGSKQAGLVT